jgi:hypothetical protein
MGASWLAGDIDIVETVYRSPLLLGIARDAYQRIPDVGDDATPKQRDAVTAVVLAGASIEAYLMDMADVIRWSNMPTSKFAPSKVDALADALDYAEEARFQVQTKFSLVGLFLQGVQPDRGSQPFQDLELLMKLRDGMVHLKPHTIREDDEHKLTTQLLQKSLVRPAPDRRTHWVDTASTRGVCRWACNVLGINPREVIARFESERQALARMDHPNVARVLDAGAEPLTRHAAPLL